jgi:hypothetical protein
VGEEETFISIRLGCCRCSGPEYIYKYMYTHGMSKNTHTNFRGPLTLVSVLTKPTQVLIRFVIHTRIHTQERERESGRSRAWSSPLATHESRDNPVPLHSCEATRCLASPREVNMHLLPVSQGPSVLPIHGLIKGNLSPRQTPPCCVPPPSLSLSLSLSLSVCVRVGVWV